jgi:hypothetical protein
MQKVLIWYGKHGNMAWDVSTLELENKAMLSLFSMLDIDYDCYADLRDMKSLYYTNAKSGNVKDAKRILQMRQHGCEYEGWDILEIMED